MIRTESVNNALETGPKPAKTEQPALGLLAIFARRKRFILRFTLGATVVAGIVTLLLPNQYTAETLVLPPTQSPSMATALMSQLGGSALASLTGASLGIKNQGDLYVSLFHSRTVEDAVIRRFGLMSRYKEKRMADTREEFEDRATVILGVKDGLIRISVRDRDPKLAADIANGYVEELRKLSATLAITEASQRRLFFQQQLQEAKDNLVTAEIAMKNTQRSTGVLQIDSQAKALIESAASLRAQIVAKQVQLQAMRSFATEENPELFTVKQQLAELQVQLSKLGGSGQDASSDLLVPMGKIPEAGMEYIRKYRDVKYNETIYELLAKQFELAKLDEARQGAVIQVADIAVAPDKKSSPHRSIIVLLVMMIAFGVAALWTVGSERWAQANLDQDHDNSIRTLRGLFSKTGW